MPHHVRTILLNQISTTDNKFRLADQWAQDCTLYNCCGPSEVTIVNTMQNHISGQPLSIGRPVPNTSVYVLDEFENPAPIGATGLMWAGGKCVSRGYLNLPQETANRYKVDRFRGNGYVNPQSSMLLADSR